MDHLDACPVCGSNSTEHILTRESVPVHQNLVYRTPREARAAAKGTIRLLCCRDCGFIFNSAFDPSILCYDKHYDNRQDCSPFFNEYVNKITRELIEKRGLRNKKIIEIGCGNGSFLKKLVLNNGAGNIGLGFDPSYKGLETILDGRLRFIMDYYGPEYTELKANAFVCRHVIEHIPAPLELLSTIRQAAAPTPPATFHFETPCVEWILRNNTFWDFFYEHCSYFTAESLTKAFELAGYATDHVQHVFNGQYLWLQAKAGKGTSAGNVDRGRLQTLCTRFALNEKRLIRTMRAKLKQAGQTGKIALWGAGAKGVTLANLIDPEQEIISCLVDINPNKQGRFIAGTGHPIVDSMELENSKVTRAVSMNPNYTPEINGLVNNMNFSVEISDIDDWVDDHEICD